MSPANEITCGKRSAYSKRDFARGGFAFLSRLCITWFVNTTLHCAHTCSSGLCRKLKTICYCRRCCTDPIRRSWTSSVSKPLDTSARSRSVHLGHFRTTSNLCASHLRSHLVYRIGLARFGPSNRACGRESGIRADCREVISFANLVVRYGKLHERYALSTSNIVINTPSTIRYGCECASTNISPATAKLFSASALEFHEWILLTSPNAVLRRIAIDGVDPWSNAASSTTWISATNGIWHERRIYRKWYHASEKLRRVSRSQHVWAATSHVLQQYKATNLHCMPCPCSTCCVRGLLITSRLCTQMCPYTKWK
jgi:hypothetical protein